MIYVVQAGDTVYQIAQNTGGDVQQIILDNQLIPPYELAVGQTLYISQERSNEISNGNGTLPEMKRQARINGYAYPFISPWVLRQTLPYLSELSVFSYGFTSGGDLIYPLWDDNWMIQLAIEYRVRPILTLTPFDERGIFNNNSNFAHRF